MWYFTWILGLLLACSLGIINVLRLEAQETWNKENIALDPVTHLMTKDTILVRLNEKVENSKRNGFPFSILLLNLSDFKTRNHIAHYEMDGILRNVVACFKDEIRGGVDIAARTDEDEFLIAMPGSPRHTAEEIALRIKNIIAERLQTPQGVAVELSTGVAEFSSETVLLESTALQVEQLINTATKNSRV